MTPLEFTFGNRQKPTDICSDFYFKIWTVSHNHRSKVTHTHMHTLLPHADTAQTEQPESPRAINISLSASKCIKWSFWERAYICLSIFEICIWFCTSTNTAKLPFALLCCALSWEAHHPTEGCIQRTVDFKRLLDSLRALPSAGGGMGRSAKQHDSGFDKHRLVRWNGCAPRWPPWVVCTQFAALGTAGFVLSVLSGRQFICQEIQTYRCVWINVWSVWTVTTASFC